MRHLYQDFRYGIRVLRNNPGFTLIAVLTLALGIAASTTVFGWINTILVHPVPGTVEDSRLVVLEIVTTGWNSGTLNFNYSSRNHSWHRHGHGHGAFRRGNAVQGYRR